MGTYIPRAVLGDKDAKDMTPKELADQNERIARWLEKQAAEKAAKQFEDEQNN